MNLKKLNNDSIRLIDSDGNKCWKNRKGQYHRRNGPAVKCINGDKAWWLNDKIHREDGPAVEYVSGCKQWWANGKLYRKDGPAIEYPNGSKEWWINDVQYHTEKEYWLKIYEMKLITKKELFLKLL